MLQGKGGCGKTLSASLVIQYLMDAGRTVICYDTDPVNESLMRIKGLKAREVKLLKNEAINVAEIDKLIEDLLKIDAEIVVDNGAASFLPLSSYLIENAIAELLDGAGKRMVIHCMLIGGGNLIDTAKGLEAILLHFPPSVKVVVWINEFFGAVEEGGKRFEDTPLYGQYKERIIGIVHLRQQNPQTFGANIGEMLKRRQTFAEALADPGFLTVQRQRLTMYRRELWEQIAPVL